MPVNIRKEDEKPPFQYQPPAKFAIGDQVYVDHAIRWGLPADFDLNAPVEITKEPFLTKIGWTATTHYEGYDYEIWESALSATPPQQPDPAIELDIDDVSSPSDQPSS